MKSPVLLLLLCFLGFAWQSCTVYKKDYDDQADEMAHNLIIADGHIELPPLVKTEEKESDHISTGVFNFKRARNGGLNAAFMALRIPKNTNNAMGAADSLINAVQQLATDHPDEYAIAKSPQEIQQHFKDGIVSLSMGLANTAPLSNDTSNVQTYYDKGIRYINLTSSNPNSTSSPDSNDSSQDSTKATGALSDFTAGLVKKMNRVGMIIDVSNMSDSTFFEVLNTTKAPVIASHSSARYFTPEFKANLSDTMITALAQNNGLMMINFGSNFISDSSRTTADSLQAHLKKWLKKHNKEQTDPEARKYIEEYRDRNYYYATISQVADHIDHVANLVGIDYVGIGSDFNGVGDTLPQNLKNVSDYPRLIQELLKRGYTKDDIRKICYRNLFRVWNEVEATAQRLSRTSN